MMKTWDKFKNPFRRKSLAETELKEDYPSCSESDVTDAENLQREWQTHLNRRATLANVTGNDGQHEQTRWDYASEYDFSVQSEASIIDAYKERNTAQFATNFDRLVEQSESERYDSDDEDNYTRHGRGNRKPSLYPQYHGEHEKEHRSSVPRRVAEKHVPVPGIAEKIRAFEPRRASCYPQSQTVREKYQPKHKTGGKHSWGISTMKPKVRKQMKRRKRAKDLSRDCSDDDDDSKYAVNITMNDLNNIIQKNINSAVKTIVSATSHDNKRRHMSPSDSFSTETETIFSGSSNQSTDAQSGFHKQMKMQLDRDKLKGGHRVHNAMHEPRSGGYGDDVVDMRRPSLPAHLSNNQQCQPPAQNMSTLNVPPQHIPQQNISPQNMAPPQNNLPYPGMNQNPMMALPSPIPSNMQQQVPQVTFNIPRQNDLQMPMPHMQQGHMPSIAQGMQFDNMLPDAYGNVNQLQLPGQQMASGSPFGTFTPSVLGSPAMNRLQNRRHTLATLGTEHLLHNPMGGGGGGGFDQLSNAIALLDRNIQMGEAGATENNKDTHSKENDKPAEKAETTPGVKAIEVPAPAADAPAAPPLTIAEQIAALSKKPSKPLEPGEMSMTGCARALFILTNIIFLVVGGGVLALGVWLMMDPNIETYFTMLNFNQDSQDFKMICYVVCFVGGVVVTIGLTGCCGAMKRNKCLITIFIVMVTGVMLIEATVVLLLFVNLDSPSAIPVLSALFADLEESLRTTLQRSVIEKYNPTTTIGATWDFVQLHLECCGGAGPDDYKTSAWKNETIARLLDKLSVPNTCCAVMDKEAEEPEPTNKLLCQAGTTGFLHDEGCYDMMIGWFKTNSTYLLVASVTALVTELFALIFALLLCRKSKKDEAKEKKRLEEKK